MRAAVITTWTLFALMAFSAALTACGGDAAPTPATASPVASPSPAASLSSPSPASSLGGVRYNDPTYGFSFDMKEADIETRDITGELGDAKGNAVYVLGVYDRRQEKPGSSAEPAIHIDVLSSSLDRTMTATELQKTADAWNAASAQSAGDTRHWVVEQSSGGPRVFARGEFVNDAGETVATLEASYFGPHYCYSLLLMGDHEYLSRRASPLVRAFESFRPPKE
jgi:hypothetical protein